ncbi:MAG TPA: hypothetical protein VMW43_04930 [Bacteroidota bacterium]|nr:hypothetical protein [Bacteroidota bacterium]
MEIKKLADIQPAGRESKVAPRKKSAGTAPGDKAEISGKARSLQSDEKAKRVSAIRQKVDDGSYFSDEVTQKTAENIANVLRKNPRAK